MSMISNFLRVSEEELNSYLEESSLLEDRVYNEDVEIDEDSAFLDLDKSWDGIIYLLTGDALEANLVNTGDLTNPFAIFFSGQLIDEEQDLGYGPAHYLTPEQLLPLQEQIATLTREQLLERFNSKDMMQKEVYPDIWEEGEEAFDYIYESFELLQELLAKAVEEKQGIISWLS